jgi:hypothetical protein
LTFATSGSTIRTIAAIPAAETPVRFPIILALLLAASDDAIALDVPMPRERPTVLNGRFAVPKPNAASAVVPTALAPAPELQALVHPPITAGPTACELRLGVIADFTPMPVLLGPGECVARDVVRLDAVRLSDRAAVAISPPAMLRCELAEAVAYWVRDDLAPAVVGIGAPLAAIANYDSYSCRGRNRIVGARVSEHGKANALDIRALRLTDGTGIEPTSPSVSKDFRETMRRSACARFMTVLGPGSDGYHEQHVHIDLAERSMNGYRMCRWDVRELGIADVPLPLPRPTAAR